MADISLACVVPRITGTAFDLCIVAIPTIKSPVYLGCSFLGAVPTPSPKLGMCAVER